MALNAGGRRHRVFEPKNRFGPLAIGVMVAFHAVLGYALVSGLGRQVIEIVKKPLNATIIQEVKLPPPPPPPPPEPPRQVVKELPRQAPPPPAYVPPPEVALPAVAAAPAITEVQSAEPAAPPPPVPQTPAAAPQPQRQDIAVACPRQARPVMPERALEEGIGGKVRAEVRIRGARVVEVQIVSGPKIFHGVVRAALAQYQCQTGGAEDVLASQEFEFKVE